MESGLHRRSRSHILRARVYLRSIIGFEKKKTPVPKHTFENRFYVYALLMPNGRAFYIGKGQSDRLFAHEKEARDRTNRTQKHACIRRIWQGNERVLQCKIVSDLPEDEAWAIELELTEQIGLANLTNESLGGKDPFVGLTPARLKYIQAARAKLRKNRQKAKVPTNFIQEICACHPVQTAKELKELLIRNDIPWSSGREKTKNKDSMLTMIRNGADEMFAALGIDIGKTISPARLILQRTKLQFPDWSPEQCIAYTRSNGPDANHKAALVIVSDMWGVFQKYVVVADEAKYLVPLQLDEESSKAPDTNPDIEGIAAGGLHAAGGEGSNWHPSLPQDVLEPVRTSQRRKL